MTFKSITTILSEYEDKGILIRFLPYFDPDESEMRELFVMPALHQWLYQADRRKAIDYKANIRAHLSQYVKGKRINNVDYMKHLNDDIFEFKIQLPRRGEPTRIFGAFIMPDVFFATHWKMRSDLGIYGDSRWDRAIDRSKTELDKLFPGCLRIPSRPFSNCVTANADYENEWS